MASSRRPLLAAWTEIHPDEYLLFHDISSVAGSGMPQLYSNLSKNHTIPSPHGAVLWPDPINKRLYQFGGEFADDKPPPLKGVHAYDVLSDTWDHFSFPDADRIAVRRTGYGAGVAIPERGEGYWYGGWLSDASEEDGGAERAATSYMVKYEMDRNSWTNTSGPDDIGRAEGAMVYIPAGDAGMLVYVGGVKDEGRNGSAEAQPMDEVLVYDVLSFKWYTQKASGDVPDSRSLFCAGVTWAEDRSSYNMCVSPPSPLLPVPLSLASNPSPYTNGAETKLNSAATSTAAPRHPAQPPASTTSTSSPSPPSPGSSSTPPAPARPSSPTTASPAPSPPPSPRCSSSAAPSP